MLVNKHSDFLALDFLTGVNGIGTLGLSYVTPSGVDTIAAYRTNPSGFVDHHTYLHVDISFLCYSKNCVQKKTFCTMIGKY